MQLRENEAVKTGRRMQEVQEISGELRSQLSGSIVVPSDASYEATRKVWNAAVSNRPAIIAFCETTADVQEAVLFARHHELSLSVRGGGHDWTGRAVRPNGLVVDLSRIRHAVVDAKAQIATVGGGAKLREIAHAAEAHGLVAAIGNCGAVGIGGLTLGGGYGPLNGLYGLAADNLIAAEVVLADGRCVIADRDHNADLFWALRGGGGNFGVVTSLRIRLHETHHMLAGPLAYAWGDANRVLCRYSGFVATAPDGLSIPVSTMPGPDGTPTLLLLPLWSGDRDRGERIMRDVRALAPSQMAQVGPMRYSELLAGFDASLDAMSGCHWEARTRSLPTPLSDAAIETITSAVNGKTSPYSMVNWHHFHGAGTRVAPDATAFGLREEHFMIEIFAGWRPGGDDGSRHKQWAEDLSQALSALALPASYPNYLTQSEREQVAHAYGGNGDRLKTLKRQYDPDNVFTSAVPLPE
jgi:FAD/FMN-containing dehydrogenase